MTAPTLSAAWISYQDDALLALSVASVAATGLATTVLRNGPSFGETGVRGVSKVVRLPRALNLADAFRRLLSEIDTDFVLLLDTDMRLLEPDATLLTKLVGECPSDVAVMVLPEFGVDGRAMKFGAAIPRRLAKTMAKDTPARAFPLGGVIYRRVATLECAAPSSQLDWGDHDLDLALAADKLGYSWVSVDGPRLEHDVFNASKPHLEGRVYRGLCSRYRLGEQWTGDGTAAWMGLSAWLLFSTVRSMVRGRKRPSDVGRLAIEVGLSGLTRRRRYLAPLPAVDPQVLTPQR